MVVTDRWPMIAAQLVATGADEKHLVQLAGLPRDASGWQIDTLAPDAIAEARAPQLSEEQAREICSSHALRRLRRTSRYIDHPLVRALAMLAPTLGYSNGVIYQAYQAAECLDCQSSAPSTTREASALAYPIFAGLLVGDLGKGEDGARRHVRRRHRASFAQVVTVTD